MTASQQPDPPSLLLLPHPPEPATAAAVRAAYTQPLSSVISRLSDENKAVQRAGIVAPILVVAVASPVLTAENAKATSVYWKRSQSLLAEVYSTVAFICAEKSIANDLGANDAGAVDVRVLLIDRDRSVDSHPQRGEACGPNNAIVLDLATFASTVHPWKRIFHASGEPGYELLAAFLKHTEGTQRLLQEQIISVEGGLSFSTSESAQSAAPNSEETIASALSTSCTSGYHTVCLGGTFDHLHPGHKLMLHAAILLLNVPEKKSPEEDISDPMSRCELVVGVSSDQLLAKKKYAEELQSWDTRARSVLEFLSTLVGRSTTELTAMHTVHAHTKELHSTFLDGALLVRCVDFHDVYGPTVSEEAIQALVVSGETRSGGQAVNEKRLSQGWSALDLYEIDVLDAGADVSVGDGGQANATATASNFASKISSTEIRKQKSQTRANTS